MRLPETTLSTGGYVPAEAWQITRRRIGVNASRLCMVFPGYTWTVAAEGMHHAAGQGSTGELIDELTRRGFDVFIPQLDGTGDFGRDASATALDAAVAWAAARGLATTNMVAYVVSMGALTLFNAWKTRLSMFKAAALAIPGLDLADLHDNDRGGTATPIETAYTNLAGYEAAVATHNPAAAGAAEVFDGKPIRAWISSNDTTTPPEIAEAWMTRQGGDAVTFGAAGHGRVGLPTADIAAFLAGHVT